MSDEAVIAERLKRISNGRGISRISMLLGAVLFVIMSVWPPADRALMALIIGVAILFLIGIVYAIRFGWARCPNCGNRFFQRGLFGPNLFWYSNACRHCGIRLK